MAVLILISSCSQNETADEIVKEQSEPNNSLDYSKSARGNINSAPLVQKLAY